MAKQSFLEKLESAPTSSFHVLDPVKAARMNAKTLFIPGPKDVANVIVAIPKGETRTIVQLRNELALLGKAETACPAKTIKYWKWLAYASEEIKEGDSLYSVPWWRVLKDNKLSPYMPGGIEGQAMRLKMEGYANERHTP